MADHKHEFCRAGIHRLEGDNLRFRIEQGIVISRICKACDKIRNTKNSRERRQRMRSLVRSIEV